MADNTTKDLIFGCRRHQCLEELQDVLHNQKTSKYATAPSNYLVCCATSICASLVLVTSSESDSEGWRIFSGEEDEAAVMETRMLSHAAGADNWSRPRSVPTEDL